MIVNRQRGVRLGMRALQDYFARVERLLRLPPDAVTVCFVTNAQIARWNRMYRRKHGPTDVLSFPAAEGMPRRTRGNGRAGYGSGRLHKKAAYLGDIAIAPGIARRNARQFARSLACEMRILILHGVLHLLGYDHEADNGEMDRVESRLRRRLELD